MSSLRKQIMLLSFFLCALLFFKCASGNEDIIINTTKDVQIYEPNFVEIFNWADDVDEAWSTVIRFASAVRDTPYVWGGNNWKGIDCSHFTYKIWYENIENVYYRYMTTENLSKIKRAKNGVKAIYFKDALPGDLLVYGDYSPTWRGHVVMLVDKEEEIVVGSHGRIGVKFITFTGFPNSYQGYELKKVLRVIR